MDGKPEIVVTPVIVRANANAPALAEGAPVPLSADLTGNLRVT